MSTKIRVRRLALISVGSVVAVLALWFFSRRPSNDRDWAIDHAVLASAEMAGDRLHIRNVRNFRYPSDGSPIPDYYDRTYDLSQLDSVWLILTPFRRESRGSAHLFLSFGFSDGDFVAVSVEGRKEKGEGYSLFKGLFRSYELIYVVADERDVIQRRANRAGKDVYVFPIRTSPERARRLLVAMLERANELTERPDFYNTFTASCSVTVLRHANAVAAKPIPGGLRILFPGYADEVAYEQGLLDDSISLEANRRRYMVSERSRRYADAPDFSLRIRQPV